MRQTLVTEENRKWWTLGAVGLGLFMIMLDNTVVNVALPSIQRDLGARLSELEWIVTGYALTFAALLLTGGKLADLLGRRLIFVAGLAVFAGSSLACALAPTAGFLIGARVVQGAGAALMNPATPLDHHGRISAASARDGDRDLGRRLGDSARDRPTRRRAPDRARRLELDLLHQRSDRGSRDRRELPPDRRVEGHFARAAARPARPAHVGHRPLRADVCADRGEHATAGRLGSHRRRVRSRGGRARRLRRARAAPAAAHARPLALPQRARSPAPTRSCCSSAWRCSASSSSSRSTCRTSSATPPSRPARRSCR